ncbi:MAG: 4-phosphopantetheinyl transferase family protein [Desulfovibrionaceae bacterium]|nr:4-phosphopantetheinyl transferase family protein [Desulfovibrionaceae bacterium]
MNRTGETNTFPRALELPGAGLVVLGRRRSGPRAKDLLVQDLLCRLEALDPGPWTPDLRLCASALGRPRLVSEGPDGSDGPAVSFSHNQGLTWAALSRSPGLGLDAASASEFGPGYPLKRVFGPAELDAARALWPEALAPAALWALKEAAVKALGCGFNLFGPLDIEAVPRPGPARTRETAFWLRVARPLDLRLAAAALCLGRTAVAVAAPGL